MSKTTKIVIAVIVIAAIAYGIYRWRKSNESPDAKVIPLDSKAADSKAA